MEQFQYLGGQAPICSKMPPKWIDFSIWAARARFDRKRHQNEQISAFGRPEPDLPENYIIMEQFQHLGGDGPLCSKNAISASGQPGLDLLENGIKMEQFQYLGSQVPICLKMLPK